MSIYTVKVWIEEPTSSIKTPLLYNAGQAHSFHEALGLVPHQLSEVYEPAVTAIKITIERAKDKAE